MKLWVKLIHRKRKARLLMDLQVNPRRRAVCPCYHFSSSASRGAGLFGSKFNLVNINPIRYNRRNLSQPCHFSHSTVSPPYWYPLAVDESAGSVRCSEAMFHLSLPHSSQQCGTCYFGLKSPPEVQIFRSSADTAGTFSVKPVLSVLSSSLRFLSCF